MNLRDYVFSNLEPQLVWALLRIRQIESSLGPEDDWVEKDRRILFEWLDSHFSHPFTFEKGVEDYICTAYTNSDIVEKALSAAGYHRNVLSTRKYRTHHSGGKQWAVGSWVYELSHDEDEKYLKQHHIYLFEYKPHCDIYGHLETSVREGKEHITETNQISGDLNNRCRNALRKADIDYYTRKV